MKKINLTEGYTMPEIAVLDIAVEQGFILSSPDFTGTTPSSDDEE